MYWIRRFRGYDGGEIGDAVPILGMTKSFPSPRSLRGEGWGEGLLLRYPLTRRYAPTSPRKRGEVKKEMQTCSTICRKSLVAFSIG